jgi:hypothetical protein
MQRRRRIVDSLKVLGTAEFWSFQVVHALLGGLLTIGGAAGALIVGDGMKGAIGKVDEQVAAIDARLESIRSTLVQFRVVQSNGVILGALSTGEGLREEYRQSFLQLMFLLRHGPALALVGELYPEDIAAFTRERDELDGRIARATAPAAEKKSWDDVLDFEMSRERQVMDLQDRLLTEKSALQAERHRLETAVDRATVAGFIVQQLGFVVILLAGLIHQHARGRTSASPPLLGPAV